MWTLDHLTLDSIKCVRCPFDLSQVTSTRCVYTGHVNTVCLHRSRQHGVFTQVTSTRCVYTGHVNTVCLHRSGAQTPTRPCINGNMHRRRHKDARTQARTHAHARIRKREYNSYTNIHHCTHSYSWSNWSIWSNVEQVVLPKIR